MDSRLRGNDKRKRTEKEKEKKQKKHGRDAHATKNVTYSQAICFFAVFVSAVTDN